MRPPRIVFAALPGLAWTAATLILVTSLAGLAAEAPPVMTDVAGEQDIVRLVQVTGTVTSPRTATLSPSVGGLISGIRVDVGDRVATGDLLVQLDPELDALSRDRASAAEAEARSALADARRRLAEAEQLRTERSIAETEVESRRTQVLMSDAALQAATADLKQREAIVRRHAIRAPFAGVISERLAEIGEWVNPGDGILTLVATDGLRFDFQAPQDIFGAITPATPIRVSLDARPNQVADAKIKAIVPVSDPRARTFLLRAVLTDDKLADAMPGMSARASLRIETGRRAVVVPRDALLRYPDGRITVWTVAQGSGQATVQEHLVQTGIEFAGQVEIQSGLEPGVAVVTRGNESLQEGQAVTLR